MSFFDKKQDVLDIKLTQFGKNLLARGFFKPVYYQFFDDGVMYNAEWASIVEPQNRSQERIQEAQNLKTQHLTFGVDETFDLFEQMVESGSHSQFIEIKRRQNPIIAQKILRHPLKEASISAQDAPVFTVKTLESEIVGPLQNYTSKEETYAIPQLQITASYKYRKDVSNVDPNLTNSNIEDNYYIDLTSNKIQFIDGSFLEIEQENIVIDIEELGIISAGDNFEIEVYEITGDGKGEVLEPLYKKEQIEKFFEIQKDDQLENYINLRSKK